MEYFLARHALSLHLDKTHSFLEIEVENFQFINNHIDLICSLSHSKKVALALSGEKNNFYGLGCDIENLKRVPPDDAERFFINESDKETQYSTLEKWCIKEACFKALSNSGENISLLKEVVINQNSFKFTGQKDFPLYNRYQIFTEDQFIIVIAYCAKSSMDVELIKITEPEDIL